MSPRLSALKPYPFERLATLLSGATPPANLRPIALSIGEPQHPTPQFLKDALAENLGGLARYPVSRGLPELRKVMAEWIARRYGLGRIDPETQVIPVAGT